MADKEKGLVEQIADSVNDLVEGIAITASEALDADEPVSATQERQSVPSYEFPAPDSAAAPAALPTKQGGAKKSAKRVKS